MARAHVGLLVIVGLACVAAAAAVAWLWPTSAPDAAGPPGGGDVTLHDGTLTAIERLDEADVAGLAPGARTLRLTAMLRDGREVSFEMVDETGDTFAVGQRVRVAEAEAPDGGATFYVNDIQRARPLLILSALFLVVVVAFGRWQGLRALVGLALTLGVVVAYVVPAVLDGRDPVLVAMSAAVVIMVATLYLTHGVRPKTTAAVVGTIAALGVTVALSWLFIELTSLTGLSSEEARMASVQVGGLSLRGLLLAGIIIGALGVLDDVTMAQASTVYELRRSDPNAGFGALFSGGMAVGRDHVAATINTLFLAYAGASLPLLILFSSSPDPIPVIASSEIVAVEIVRTLVGSIGLVTSVPVTTALAAWLAAGVTTVDDGAQTAPDGHGGRRRGGERRTPAGERAGPDGDGGRPRGGERRRTPADEPSPFGIDLDDGDQDWERRLRESYGLHRRPDRSVQRD